VAPPPLANRRPGPVGAAPDSPPARKLEIEERIFRKKEGRERNERRKEMRTKCLLPIYRPPGSYVCGCLL